MQSCLFVTLALLQQAFVVKLLSCRIMSNAVKCGLRVCVWGLWDGKTKVKL